VLVAVLGRLNSTSEASTAEVLEKVERLEELAKRRVRDQGLSLLTFVRIQT
jgi:hypothetical protein